MFAREAPPKTAHPASKPRSRALPRWVSGEARPSTQRWVSWVLGLAAAALILYSTATYGVSAAHFGVNNIAAAEGLLTGRGLSNLRLDPFVYWGPLFPALLAAGRLVGLHFLDAGRWLTILSVLVFVALHARLLGLAARSTWTIVLASALMVLSPQFLPIEASLRSQPFFLALMLGMAISLLRWLERPGALWMWVTALFGVALAMHRYEGLLLAGAASLVILLRQPNTVFGRRFGLAAFVSGLPTLVLAGWFVRNKRVSGTWTGVRVEPLFPPFEQLIDGWNTLCLWLVPWSEAPALRNAVVLSVAALIVGAIVVRLRRVEPRASRDALYVYALFPLSYGGGLVALALTMDMDKIGERILFPLLPFVLGFVLLACEEWTLFLARHAPRARALAVAGTGALAVLNLSVCLPASAAEVARMRREGAGGIASPEFSGSPLAAWLREHPLEGPLHSNQPEFVLLFASRRAYLIPPQREKVQLLVELQNRPSTWVWVCFVEEEWALIDEVRAQGGAEVVAELANGVVLSFR